MLKTPARETFADLPTPAPRPGLADGPRSELASRPVLRLSWEQRVARASRASWGRVERARAGM